MEKSRNVTLITLQDAGKTHQSLLTHQSRSRPSRMTFYTLRQSHPCITRLQCPIQLWMIPHPQQTATHDAFVDHPSASWSIPKTKGLNILGGRKCSISAIWFVWCKLNCSFYSLVCAYIHRLIEHFVTCTVGYI